MNSDHFTMAQRSAMLDLKHVWPDRKIVLVGASALACWLDMRWRRTNDLDLTVVAGQVELAERLRRTAWKRDKGLEQRWTSPQDVIVDILPASAADLAKGELVFAMSGHVMNLTGFDLAFDHNAALNLDARTTLDVATVPVIAVLKMAAWLDRPSERDRDLEDLSHIFNEYLEEDDDRRWAEAVMNAGVTFENQSVFALGHDIAEIIDERHARVLSAFFDAVSDEDSARHAHFARHFRPGNSSAILAERIEAFRLGLDR